MSPPQPASFVFVLDASRHARTSGFFGTAVATVTTALDSLPGGANARVGLLVYAGNMLHWFDCHESRGDGAFAMLCVPGGSAGGGSEGGDAAVAPLPPSRWY